MHCLQSDKNPRHTDKNYEKKSGGEIKVNPDSQFFGRSIYICKNEECVNNAFKKGKIFKILKIKDDDLLKEKIRAVLDK